MVEQFESLIELITYFDTEDKCIKYFQHQRWQGAPTCPHCEYDKVYEFSDGKRFKCASCRKQFTVRVGTIFEDSKISLKKWFVAIYLVICHKKGISSHQLAKDIKVTQKTAWFMLHRIRFGLGLDNQANEQLDGIVEVDETFVGGKNKNRHYDKKVPHSTGRSFKDKTPILGIMQRGGKVKTIVVPNTKGYILKPIIREVVKYGSTVVSDEWTAYNGLNIDYFHLVVDHGRGKYVNGYAHTNTVEGFWAWIKRMITRGLPLNIPETPAAVRQ